MMFDWTFSVGNLVAMVMVLVSCLGFIYGMKGDIRLLASQIKALELDLLKIDRTLERMIELFSLIARQEERISSSERRLSDLNNRLHAVEMGYSKNG